MKYIREIIIVIMGIIILLMATCNDTPKPDIVTVTKVRRDTVFLEQKERIIEVPVTKYIPISPKDSSTAVAETEPHFKKYEQPYEDSLLAGTIINTVDGTLLSTELKYTPKFPKYITETITTTTTETVVKKVDKTSLALGFRGAIIKNTFEPEILLSLSHKRAIYQAGYNPINKYPSVAINYKLW